MNDNLAEYRKYPAAQKQNSGRLDLSDQWAPAAWSRHLICSETGRVKPILSNAISALRLAPEWSGVLAYNDFTLKTVTKNPAPWKGSTTDVNWTDHDDVRACEWLQHNGIFVNSKIAGEAVQTVAMESRFHPVRDYLNDLRWDGESRIGQWLIRYFGAPDTSFVRAVGTRWLISGVARIFQPGCQADHTLLLEGPQGIRKSTGLRVLAGDQYFADHISDLGTKDSRLDLLGKWVIELAELDRVRRSDVERIKAFLTARTDHFRPPYGRRSEDIPRSCIFAATVNDPTPLVDATGNRRFWPIHCGEIHIDNLGWDRDQLWAEAYTQYIDGKCWWLETSELNDAANVEQDERYEPGVWDDTILEWLEDPTQGYELDGKTNIPITPFCSTKDRATVTDILRHCIGKSLDRCTPPDRLQVVRCLTHAGWKRKQERSGAWRGKWFYLRPSGTTCTSVEPTAEPGATC